MQGGELEGGGEGGVAGEAYQSDDGGSGPGARHDVQVVGQVELGGGIKRDTFVYKVKVSLTFRLENQTFLMSGLKLRGLGAFS